VEHFLQAPVKDCRGSWRRSRTFPAHAFVAPCVSSAGVVSRCEVRHMVAPGVRNRQLNMETGTRTMYQQGSDQYKYHVSTYSHPSKVGYKDLVIIWKADKWDPDHQQMD
jgi:alpha-L-fucosidase